MAASDPTPASTLPALTQDQGFALLMVLWSMALLAILGTQVTGAGRAQSQLASALRQGAQLQEAADAAIYETIWHMLDGSGDYWTPGAMTRVLPETAAPVTVTITDERGKLDLNQAPPALLQALFTSLGASRTTAQTAGNAIAEWRSPQPVGLETDTPAAASYRMEGKQWGPAAGEFQRIDELQLVLGMTPALYQAAAPYVTLGLEQGPWLQYAGPMILTALARAKRDSGLTIDAADARGPVVLRIEAHVSLPNGAAFTRRVLFRLDGTLSGPAWKYRILSWEDGPGGS